MSMKTLYLEWFSHRLCGSHSKNAAGMLVESAAHLGGLAALCERFIPASLLAGLPKSRDRSYSLAVVFWAFLSQALTRSSACREAVRRVQAWSAAAGRVIPDSGTSAYCMARRRLPIDRLRQIFEKVGTWIDTRASQEHLWCGRSVKVIDGTGVSMAELGSAR